MSVRLFLLLWLVRSPSDASLYDSFTEPTRGLPSRIPSKLIKEGFYSEVIGYAAPKRRDCGLLTIGYEEFLNGEAFKEILHQMEIRVDATPSAYPSLFHEVWVKEAQVQITESKKDMGRLFQGYKADHVNLNSTIQRQQLANPMTIATVKVVGFAINAMSDLKNWFFGFNSAQDEAIERMRHIYSEFTLGWAKVQKTTTNALLAEIYSTRISSMMSRVRDQFRKEVTETMDKLMIDREISKGLARIGEERGVWAAIMKLIGKRASDSLLYQTGVKGLASIEAVVSNITDDTIIVKACYPTAEEHEKSEVYHIEPAGSMKDINGLRYFTFPNTHRYWMKPSSCNNIECLEPMNSEECERIGSVFLCDRGGENLGDCPLIASKRKDCSESRIRAPENKFLLQRNMLSKVVVATDARYGTLTFETNSTIENFAMKQNVFAIELPEDSILTIYSIKVNSRIQSAIQRIKVEFTPEVPTNPVLPEPSILPSIYKGDEFNSDAFFNFNLVLFDIIVFVITVVLITRRYSPSHKRKNIRRNPDFE